MSEVIRPTNWADATSDWELRKSPILTSSERANNDSESDNVPFVGCEEACFTWCEEGQEVARNPPNRPHLRSTVGIMSTCGPVVVELTETGTVVVCSWCTSPEHLAALNRIHRVTHTICSGCLNRMLEAL